MVSESCKIKTMFTNMWKVTLEMSVGPSGEKD